MLIHVSQSAERADSRRRGRLLANLYSSLGLNETFYGRLEATIIYEAPSLSIQDKLEERDPSETLKIMARIVRRAHARNN